MVCTNKTGLNGVSQAGKKFVAIIHIDGKKKHFGTFTRQVTGSKRHVHIINKIQKIKAIIHSFTFIHSFFVVVD